MPAMGHEVNTPVWLGGTLVGMSANLLTRPVGTCRTDTPIDSGDAPRSFRR